MGGVERNPCSLIRVVAGASSRAEDNPSRAIPMQVCHNCVAKAMTSSAATIAMIPVPISARGDVVATRRPTMGLAMIAESAARPKSNPTSNGLASRCRGKTGSTPDSTAAPTMIASTIESDPGTLNTANGPAVSSVVCGGSLTSTIRRTPSSSATPAPKRNGEAVPKRSTRNPAKGGPMRTPSVIVDIAMPIAWPRRAIVVVAAIRDNAATHDMPPASPWASRAISSNQYGPPVAKSTVAVANPTRPIKRGVLGPWRSTVRPAKGVAMSIATA